MPLLDVEQLKKDKGRRMRVSFEETLPPIAAEGGKINRTKPARFELLLTNIGNAITVEGTINVEFAVRCDRCLKEFTCSMAAGFAETYYDAAQPPPGGAEEDWIPYSGDSIDITPEAKSAITVNLPMRFICLEDCRGLCPVCGTDLNKEQCKCNRDQVDPRLAKLQELLKS